MDEIIEITKKLNKIALNRNQKKIEYKKYDTKHLNFSRSSYGEEHVDNS
jgi:hypothetical protein